MYSRLLALPPQPKQSFFLWGPRQTGKTTLLKQVYPEAFRIDLLKTDVLMRYLQEPSILREQVTHLPKSQIIIIDEIQNIDGWEHFVRRFMDMGFKFYITGSNASLLSRELGTRLTGRYVPIELFPFSMNGSVSKKELNIKNK